MTDSSEQLDEAINELDDIYIELKQWSKSNSKNVDVTGGTDVTDGTPMLQNGSVVMVERSTETTKMTQVMKSEEIYKSPSSKPFHQSTYQSPTPFRHAAATFNKKEVVRTFSQPVQEPLHGTLPYQYSTVGRKSGAVASSSLIKDSRLTSSTNFIASVTNQSASAMYGLTNDPDYDQVPDEDDVVDHSGRNFDDKNPDYDEIPDEPATNQYASNGTLPFPTGNLSTFQQTTSPMYTQVKRRSEYVNEGDVVLEMVRLESNLENEKSVTSRDNQAYLGSLPHAQAVTSQRITSSEEGGSQSEARKRNDQVVDSGSERKRSIIGAYYIPEPIGPIIDATKADTDSNTQCKYCSIIMAILLIFAIALFLFMLVSYIYVGKTIEVNTAPLWEEYNSG